MATKKTDDQTPGTDEQAPAPERVTLVAVVNIPRSMIADAGDAPSAGRVETGDAFETDPERAAHLVAIGYAHDPSAPDDASPDDETPPES